MRLNHLPQRCYHQDSEGKLCLIIAGMDGYFLPLASDQWTLRSENKISKAEDSDIGWSAKSLNIMLGVSPEEEDVMVGGSMFGWDTPLVQDFINVREDEAQESLALSREMDHINGYQ
jgi:hypothetical protein